MSIIDEARAMRASYIALAQSAPMSCFHPGIIYRFLIRCAGMAA